MSESTKKINLLLIKLSQQELKEIKNKIDYLISDSSILKDNDLIYLDLFYLCLSDKLNQLLKIGGLSPLPVLKKLNNKVYKKLITVYEYILEYLDKLIENSTKDDKFKFFRLYADLLGNYTNSIKIEMVCLTGLLNNYEKFPTLIEDNFPGYLESGLFEVILGEK